MKKQKIGALLLAGALCLTLAGCEQAEPSADTPASDTPERAQPTVELTDGTPLAAAEPDAAQEPAHAATAADVTCTVELTGDSATITGSGAAVEGNVVTITKEGVYRLTGALTDGQLVVSCAEDADVGLLLDGVVVSCTTGAALDVTEAGLVTVTLAADSENALSSALAGDGAAVYSKADLLLTGTGTLTVKGAHNGAHGKDDLTVESGTYVITAGNDALKGKDSVTVRGGSLTLDAGGDGIQSDNDADAERGAVTLSGGSFSITAAGDGVAAETALSIAGGTFAVRTGGGAAAAPAHTGDQRRQWSESQTAADDGTSCKGLKAGTALTVTGGSFALDCSDDAVHSNGDVTVSGGTFTVATGDDGFHADDTLTVSGGSITVTRSYEGLEGLTLLVYGGTMDITASDDGLNAAGGDGSGGYGLFGTEDFGDGSASLTVTGGSLTVDAGGDGLDSNGTLRMEGGTVLVNGPTDSGNGALDCDDCAVTGGTLIAVGASGMAVGFGSGSTQCSFLCNFSETIAAGSAVTVTDSAGSTVFTFTAGKTFNSVVFTSPSLVQGATYTLSAGAQSVELTLTEIATNSAGGFGGMGGGKPGGSKPSGTAPDGTTPPDGTTRPTMPDGATLPDGATPPSMPDGTTPPDAASGATPPTTQQ